MSNNPFEVNQNPPPLELDSNSHRTSNQVDSRLADLRIRREKSSETRLSDMMDDGFGNMDHIHCNYCHQPILINVYNQHLLECPRRPSNSLRNTSTSFSNNFSNQSIRNDRGIEEDSEPNQLQLVRQNQENLTESTPRRRPGRLLNLFNMIRNPLSRIRPEPIQEPPRDHLPFFPNIFSNLSRPEPNETQPITNALPQEPSNENSNPDSQIQDHDHNHLEDGLGTFPHGAMIVRTVQPGPNGSVIVRMRIIPMDEVFGRSEENREDGEPGSLGIFGAILGMLAGLQGNRFVNVTNLFDLFQEEQGLDKNALDSLPIVTYSNENFKNVDAESKRCAICLEQFEDGNEVRYLWCIHRFHKNCVDQWLDKHTNCPICKKDYSEALKDTFE